MKDPVGARRSMIEASLRRFYSQPRERASLVLWPAATSTAERPQLTHRQVVWPLPRAQAPLSKAPPLSPRPQDRPGRQVQRAPSFYWSWPTLATPTPIPRRSTSSRRSSARGLGVAGLHSGARSATPASPNVSADSDTMSRRPLFRNHATAATRQRSLDAIEARSSNERSSRPDESLRSAARLVRPRALAKH